MYRDGLCPACGGPLEECTAPEKTGPRFRATYTLCQRRKELETAQKAKADSDNFAAYVWWTEPTGR